jgi:hypothetical protein
VKLNAAKPHHGRRSRRRTGGTRFFAVGAKAGSGKVEAGFPKKIMLHQKDRAPNRFNLKSSRAGAKRAGEGALKSA